MEPVHHHYCKDCIFVGIDTPEPGEPPCNQVDLYIHVGKNGYHSLIRRYGSEDGNYGSMGTPHGLRIAKYRRVWDAWQAKCA